MGNELMGVMTFGAPRFNKECEYELVRLAWDFNYIVIGGAQKLFTHFIKHYNPSSIIVYNDLSKFSGDVYKKLGFKYEGIT